MNLESIEEKENRYRIICLTNNEDYIIGCLQKELKGSLVTCYDKNMFSNIIYDTECSENEINSFIEKHFHYLATFESYQKMFD